MQNSTGFAQTGLVLWSVQFALTTAFALAMGGLAVRLERPLMRALALLWLLQLAIHTTTLVYFGTVLRVPVVSALVSAVFCALCFVALPLTRAVVNCAAEAPATLPPVRVWKAAVIGAVFGIAMQGWRVGLWRESELFIAIWSRLVVHASSVALLYWLVVGWRRFPAARERLLPLLVGGAAQMVAFGVEAYVRIRALVVGSMSYDPALTIISSMTAGLVFGVACLLAALESEREAMAADGERLRVAALQASESQRLQSLGSLASGVAHDFNNVLGVVLSGADMVEQSINARNPVQARADLDAMLAAAQRGAGLTRRLLSYARSRPESPVRFAVGDALQELVPMLERLVSSRLALHTIVRTNQAVLMDRTQFEQIVVNLIVNARDATPDAGHITLGLEDVDCTEDHTLQVGRVTPGLWVCLSVQDTGRGIPTAVQDRIFDPFFTTKGAQGTGLGLATVATAVREAGGAIQLISSRASGTRFTIWLPC